MHPPGSKTGPVPSFAPAAVLAAAALLAGCAGPPVALPSNRAGEILVRAERALEAGKIERAGRILEALRKRKLAPRDEEKYLFLQARYHYRRGEPWKAFLKLEALASRFPVTGYAPQAAWMEFQIGKYLLHARGGFLGIFSQKSYGIRVLKHLVINWPQQVEPGNPKNVLADDAEALLGEDLWKNRDWEGAVARYSQLVQDYPDSEWAPLAYFRIAMAWFHQVEGPRYDLGIMKRAERELSLFLKRKGGTPKQKETARKALARLHEWMARRAYRTAHYYMTVGSPVGAWIYLKELVDQYPGTQAAREGKKELPMWEKRAKRWKARHPFEKIEVKE